MTFGHQHQHQHQYEPQRQDYSKLMDKFDRIIDEYTELRRIVAECPRCARRFKKMLKSLGDI